MIFLTLGWQIEIDSVCIAVSWLGLTLIDLGFKIFSANVIKLNQAANKV